MQNRIDRLEGLVLSLMNPGAGPEATQRSLSMKSGSESTDYPQDVDVYDTTADSQMQGGDESDTDQMVQSLGVMRVDNNKSMYYSDGHWAAVLSDVSRSPSDFGLIILLILSDLRGQELLPRTQETI